MQAAEMKFLRVIEDKTRKNGDEIGKEWEIVRLQARVETIKLNG